MLDVIIKKILKLSLFRGTAQSAENYTIKTLYKSMLTDMRDNSNATIYHEIRVGIPRGWHSYTFNTVIRWTRLTRQTSKWLILCIYKTIRTYMLVHEKTRLRPKSQWTFSDVTTSLVCKVGLFYSSVSINQLFNTKNSFLQLFSWKATLNYEVLFKSVFFTNFFTWNCSKKCWIDTRKFKFR